MSERMRERTGVAAVGGGHGLSRALAALLRMHLAPTAIVTVADDGGSSGRLRRDLGVIALGDLRMALLALGSNERLAQALAHRFSRGELEGHSLGNLMLLALLEQRDGDVVAALDDAAETLACSGRVLPSTTVSVQLEARVSGEDVGGQVRVATAVGRVERVWLEPDAPPACPEAVEAVRSAEVILLGPGSLFTSVIAALLVPELGQAVAESSARVIYVCNLLTQPGETSGFDAAAHVDALLEHVPGLTIDAVLLHDGPGPRAAGQAIGASLDHPDVRAVHTFDLATRDGDGGVVAAHDPDRLAAALSAIGL